MICRFSLGIYKFSVRNLTPVVGSEFATGINFHAVSGYPCLTDFQELLPVQFLFRIVQEAIGRK